MKGKTKMFLWFLIVIAVVVALIFITINLINNKLENPIQLESGMAEKDGVEKNMQTQNDLKFGDNNEGQEGVKVTVLKEGTGQVAKNGDTVEMNYTGKLTDGTVFDSNVDPKFQHVEPFEFILGGGQVIKGWDVGILGMKEGEKRTLEIKPEYAYGSTGAGSVIPPNATLIFDVELVSIKK